MTAPVRTVNAEGIELIKTFEGLKDGGPDTPGLEPYLDPIGIPTIGWGSIWGIDGKRVTMEHRAISLEEAEGLLRRELFHTRLSVQRMIRVPLTDNQFAALASFTYNLGGGNLQASTLRTKLNREDYFGAADEFPKWRRAGGVILPGLVRRRAAERALFLA
ncbi:MAG: lysozyme [Alphaproteobacteria bacterium]|nr:lysozyme [Alphaproteobacteria bacterium]